MLAAVRAELHDDAERSVAALHDQASRDVSEDSRALLDGWPAMAESYSGDEQVVRIRDRELRTRLTRQTLADSRIPRVALPRFTDHGELLRFLRKENLPGYFPYAAGVFPFKRDGEDPARMGYHIAEAGANPISQLARSPSRPTCCAAHDAASGMAVRRWRTPSTGTRAYGPAPPPSGWHGCPPPSTPRARSPRAPRSSGPTAPAPWSSWTKTTPGASAYPGSPLLQGQYWAVADKHRRRRRAWWARRCGKSPAQLDRSPSRR
jgi:hypothetical protein